MDKQKFSDNRLIKKRLRIIGGTLFAIGIVLALIAFIDFFSAVSSMNGPDNFFLFFIAFPLIFVGSACLSFSSMGKIARYKAEELAPIAKDTVNYMLDGTKEEIADTINLVRRQGKTITCPKCHNQNNQEAKYCDECGEQLHHVCQYCNEHNDADAKFCKNCGKKI